MPIVAIFALVYIQLVIGGVLIGIDTMINFFFGVSLISWIDTYVFPAASIVILIAVSFVILWNIATFVEKRTNK
jgi:hypothetical protein